MNRHLSRDCPFFFYLVRDYPGTQLEALLMRQFTKNLVKFLKAEDGPTAVEYAVMLALIIVVCIGAITTLGNNANTTFGSVGTTIGGTGS
jgi:pilus assembly protein Flp/PilA